LRIGAFNVRTFGKSKMSKEHIADILAKIVVRYDVMLLQEIRDISGWAVDELLKLAQAINPNYNYIISKRLGRSSYKEQYAFFYRTDRLKVKSTHQYDDGPDDGTDIFEREPYCVELEPFDTGKCTHLIRNTLF
ncbi:deoxyribonuclease-1-like, partial [Patella vulgata]|uniref:deoxyribonuclease-1-like n=1 Tax=Patella vulgata TaxID=6465 RepID=UPI00217FD6A9